MQKLDTPPFYFAVNSATFILVENASLHSFYIWSRRLVSVSTGCIANITHCVFNSEADESKEV